MSDTVRGALICPVCGRRFFVRVLLDDHVRDEHPDPGP